MDERTMVQTMETMDAEDAVEEAFAGYHDYHLSTMADGSIRGVVETNDNLDHGGPSEYARWSVTYKNRDMMARATGLSHIGALGCKVTVILDGEKI